MRSVRVGLLLWFVVAPVAFADDAEAPAEALADEIAQLVAEGRVEDAASRLHYPEGWSDARRAEDRGHVAANLRFLRERFGAFRDPVRERGRASFYEVGTGGGDTAYWSSLAPDEVEDFLYAVDFAELGRGFLKVRTVRSARLEAPAVQLVAFALPADAKGAVDRIVSISRGLLESRGVDLPPNVDELLEHQLRRMDYRGARPPAGGG